MIEVITPGTFTTIQDSGRKNLRKYGVPESGTMDKYSAQLANWLLNNPIEAPVLEITLTGPELHFKDSCYIGITGADMAPTRNNSYISLYEAIKIQKGDVLKFKSAKNGCRTYLAIQGGFLGTEFLKSQSTYTLAGIGRPLKKGDELRFLKVKDKTIKHRKIPEYIQTKFQQHPILRVVEGPEFSFITEDSPMGIAGNYTVDINSDRMGIRLSGFHGDLYEKEIISSPVNKGTIQVLPDGMLNVVMNDGQVSGGYPRIGNIISADLHLLAQVKPGEYINLMVVSIEKAQQLWEYQSKLLQNLKSE